MAEGGGLLNRYTALKPYRGFESLRLRQLLLIYSCGALAKTLRRCAALSAVASTIGVVAAR